MESNLSNLPALVLASMVVYAILSNTGVDLRRLLSGRNVVLIGIASWYLLEAIMLPSGLSVFSQDEYMTGIIAVCLAMVAFLLGYHKTGGCRLFPQIAQVVRRLDDPALLWRLVVIGAVIGFTPIVIIAGSEVIEDFDSLLSMRKSWGGPLARGRYGDARAAFLMLEMFVTGVAPFAAIILLDRRYTLLQRIICAFIVCWPVIRAYGLGTRSTLITTMMPLLMIIYIKASPKTQLRLLIIALLCVPLIYQFMAAIVASRGEGVFSWESSQEVEYVGNEMFRELLFIRRQVPSHLDFQFGYVYYVQLVNPIPRFLWPDKPTLDTGLLMADMYGEVSADSGEALLTISPGLIGEMYLNFGWLGILGLSAFGGWLVRGWDTLAEENSTSLATMIYYFCGLAVLFILGRSFTLNMFYGLLSFASLAWIIGVGQKPVGANE